MIINLILLAAGYSSRFGENKLLYEISGRPMYRYALECALLFQENPRVGGTNKEPFYEVRVILVTAYDAIAEYALKTANFLHYGGEKDRILVRNNNRAAGISYSIRLGIGASQLVEENDCLMFCVCDQPSLTCDEFLSLADGFCRSGRGIGVLCAGESMGNPVLFKKRYKEELLSLTGDVGGKQVVKRHLKDVFFCGAKDKKSLIDIDKKEEGILRP